MTADRRVDPAGEPRATVADHLLVERLAHAVQALELVIPALARHLDHGREGVRVVGRELRIEGVRVGEDAARAGDVGLSLIHI